MSETPYQRQLLVCVFGPWCRLDGAVEVHKALKHKAKEAGLANDIRVTKCGCLGQCGNGPMLAMWPDNVWYGRVQASDVDELFDAHIVGGRPVERLRYRPAKPGSNKTAEVVEKEKAGKGAE